MTASAGKISAEAVPTSQKLQPRRLTAPKGASESTKYLDKALAATPVPRGCTGAGGGTALSTQMPDIRLAIQIARKQPFARRPANHAGVPEVSRFSCRKCIGVSGVYDYAGLAMDSRYRPRSCCLPPV